MNMVSVYAKLILGFSHEELHAFVMDEEYIDMSLWLSWHRKDPQVKAALRRLSRHVRLIAH